ncbi:putative HNHc nuclease [Staphylococcus chromogenes]|uniref:putative HNHc nuclease n=1 Tax=Staphylococcus chromogenes TaxID=46126 RepID=UPI00288880B2|nr:putative HNHc nuclease [Staphylococcus chromogenes]MDT0715401.1 putative HNHc nuclease [Staphylococcus chromogenes]
MSQIVKYQKNHKGTYTVVVTDVEIPEQAIELLDLNQPIDVDCTVIDPNSITGKQRRKIFALVKDIEEYTGQPMDYMRHMFIEYVRTYHGYDERISLSNCTRTQANQVIEVILDWVFHNDIPLNYKTSDLLKQDKSFLYWSTVNRNCVICGKPHSDLAHRYAVGRGRDRTKINHYGNQVLALCREHHQSQHNIGMDSFNDKYHLHDSWVDVDERLNKMLKGEKTNG